MEAKGAAAPVGGSPSATPRLTAGPVPARAGGPFTDATLPTPNRKYYFVNISMNWWDAQYWCQVNLGGTLAWFENEKAQIKYDEWLQSSAVGNGLYDDYW